jgi:hypothetical protein
MIRDLVFYVGLSFMAVSVMTRALVAIGRFLSSVTYHDSSPHFVIFLVMFLVGFILVIWSIYE